MNEIKQGPGGQKSRVSWRPVFFWGGGGSLPTKNWLLPPQKILSRLYVDNDLQ